MPDPITPEWAWDTAEQRCYEYLQEVLGTVPDVQGFRSELPRLSNDITACNQWAFAIVGGGSNPFMPEPSARNEVNSWHNEAMFEGRFTNRQLALRTIGALRAATPAGEAIPTGSTLPAITGVQKLWIAAHPTVQRGVVELENDLGSSAGMVRVWIVTISMGVVYNNQARIT